MGRSSRRALIPAVALSAAAALALAELLFAATGLDAKLMNPLLYYQTVDLPVHRPSEDVALHYELRPGASEKFRLMGPRTVSVNAFGFRDPPRRAAKAPGVVRIICLGGSNTYGAAVQDAQTYPAHLERLLNGAGPRRYEVWNAGVSAYTLAQNVAAARSYLARYEPDLLLFQLSNPGRRAFLSGQDFMPYFEADPRLYAENLRWPENPSRAHAALLRRWRLYRCLVLSVNRLIPASYGNGRTPQNDGHNHAAFRSLVREHGGRVGIALLVHPGMGLDERLRLEGVPFIELRRFLPAGAGEEYRHIHPPARVYAWYARELAGFLRRERLLR